MSRDSVKHSGHLAISSKRSSVAAGYYDDDFIEHILPGTKENPLLNFLYYLRVYSVRKLIDLCIAEFSEKVQFVNFGCGMDTISLWLIQKYGGYRKGVVCFELDFRSQLEKKNALVSKCDKAMEMFTNFEYRDGLAYSDQYRMIPIDLSHEEELKKLEEYGFSRELPTIFLSELVLVYVEAEAANKVIKYARDCAKQSCFIYMEPISTFDSFGKLLVSRFRSHGLGIHGTEKYPTIEDQINRYKSLGWEHIVVKDMNYIMNRAIDEEEMRRVRSLEILDEVEELALLCNHYAVGTATTDDKLFKKILEFLDRNKEQTKSSYTTQQICEMILDGTIKKIQPSILEVAPFSKFFSEIISDSIKGKANVRIKDSEDDREE
ncbi:leucine carboxyl methyltransferase, putative [Theileria equi strain WA]|uniref:[phosphatase 2A protein]-leucine-carboxy methyltransferase n=1 Tax=Theileria equi strain WA TaxID=1537102 RepID=L0B0B7_THEEQ|nr:leucine carboxyl methyltransferase, putative [Theileria equi strain WA]AFZ80923.1 leucine carboxyl methyltransferase, putative [Theileria equi strain WA]|eukprot:XP_004830589.1 leucine carboxyl methyltransferase, putative [Theileria equi strain WA]